MQQRRAMVCLVTLVFLLLPTLSHAAPPVPMGTQRTGWYLTGAGGINSVADLNIGIDQTMKMKDGYFFSLAAGIDSGLLRCEFEGTFSDNEVDRITAFGTDFDASGDVSVAALLANVYLVWRNPTRVRPYIGLGAGYARLDFNNVRLSNGGQVLDGSDTSSITQLLLGVDYRANDRLDVGLRFQAQGIFGITFADAYSGSTTSDDYIGLATSLALRYRF